MFDSLRSAVNEGAQQARAAAEKAIPQIKAAVSGATYWLGYGASFATVFSYTVARELAPQALKAGCREGAQAGRKAGQECAEQFKAQFAGRSDASATVDPSGPAAQPGVA